MTAPAALAPHPRARRHTTATMTTARTMFADGDGWTCVQIAHYLTEQTGARVDHITVRMWVDDAYREQRHAAKRARARRARERAARERAREREEERFVRLGLALRARGVPYSAIAAALDVCEGIRRSPEQTRRILREAGTAPDHRRGRTFKAA